MPDNHRSVEKHETQPQRQIRHKASPEPSKVQDPARVGSGEFSQAAWENHAALLSDGGLSHSMNAMRPASIVGQLQRDYGNRYVQRLFEHISRLDRGNAPAADAEGPMPEAVLDALQQQLVAQAQNGWVYRVRFAGKDDMAEFSVVITYPEDVDQVADLRENMANVADPWAGRELISLGDFMAGQNQHGAQLSSNDFEILNKQMAGGAR